MACPTSLPNIARRTHERSASHHAPLARMRFFSFLSLHEKKLKEVGQEGKAPNSAGSSCPTSLLNSGAGRTAPEALEAEIKIFTDIA